MLGYGAGKASALIQRMGATVRREGGTLGGASGEWVEEAESRASGQSGSSRRSQEVGWSQRRVGVEEEDSMKHADAETDPRPGKEDEDDHDDDSWTASRSVICRSCGAGRGAALKRCIVTSIWRSHSAPATTRAGRHGRKWPHWCIRRDLAKLWYHLAPNPVI